MSETRFDADDPILPKRIVHNSEQIWTGDQLEQSYNYLVYEFETERYIFRARAYLDDIDTVSILGAFDRDDSLKPHIGIDVDERVVAYLRRRYAILKVLSRNGYVVLRD